MKRYKNMLYTLAMARVFWFLLIGRFYLLNRLDLRLMLFDGFWLVSEINEN